MTERLFVYGTLRRGTGGMAAELARSSRLLGEGTVAGRLYDLGSYPGLVLGGAGSEKVRGELYELHGESAALLLMLLDDYEGCVSRPGVPPLFRRERVAVRLGAEKDEVEAWTYVYARPVSEEQRLASGEYGAAREARRTRPPQS